jgi:twitching motility protein PilT
MQGQPKIETLLEEVVRKKGSDLHLQVGLPPMLRVDGALLPVPGAETLNEEVVETLIYAVLDEDQKQVLIKDKELDFSFAFGELGRFRVNAFHERGNLAAALRLIPNEILTVTQLGLPPIIDKFAEFARGLVLITGPTGSGKSTTLAAMIHKINMEQARHIITVEDPIEYTHKSHQSIVVQREVHYDTYSFATALRSVLREDPDVVLIGEMRDLETIASAITIAETGHLVLATLHTNSASQTVDRVIDVFPSHQQAQVRSQMANILMAICSQRLIPSVGGGRVAAAEILVSTPAVCNIIREGKTHQLEAVIQTGSEFGMQSMDKTLVLMIKNGTITYEEAINYAIDQHELDRLIRE